MRVGGGAVALIATALWLGITCLDASAEMRVITIHAKYCGGNPPKCTGEVASPVKIDWRAGTIEFVELTILRGQTLRFGRTVHIDEPHDGTGIRSREPTKVQVSKEGLRLTIEVTTAWDFTTTGHFERLVTTYLFAFKNDGECASFTVSQRILEKNKNDAPGGVVGTSCSGRIDGSR